jgi:hypothetical protein
LSNRKELAVESVKGAVIIAFILLVLVFITLFGSNGLVVRVKKLERITQERSLPMPVSSAQAVSCCDAAHHHCCNCCDRLKSLAGRTDIPADVQAIIEQCIEDCRKCCDQLAQVSPPLAGKRP